MSHRAGIRPVPAEPVTSTEPDGSKEGRTMSKLSGWTRRTRRIVGAGAVAAVASAGAGVAWGAGAFTSSIPDSAGVVHGCVSTSGSLRSVYLIDPSTGGACPNGFVPVSWNQQGPQGQSGAPGTTGSTGATGPQGPSGPAGPAGTTTQPWVEFVHGAVFRSDQTHAWSAVPSGGSGHYKASIKGDFRACGAIATSAGAGQIISVSPDSSFDGTYTTIDVFTWVNGQPYDSDFYLALSCG